MISLFAWALLVVGAEPAVDTVLVAPPEFIPALEPWMAYRYSQGHRFAHIGKTQSADEIQKQIRQLYERGGGKLKYVVLVGDAANSDPKAKSRLIPAFYPKAKVNIHYGSSPEIATDNLYSDLDGDALPDLAVGRWPADTAEEVALLVRKTLAYEKLADHGQWRQKVNIVAGVGGFGPLVDSVVEMTTKQFLIKGIPAAYQTSMTYGSWRSPYCPDPRLFQTVTRQRLQEGCLFWVYVGHGQPRELDRIQLPGSELPILTTDDLAKLKLQPQWPIAVMLACYTGAYDQPQDCLAEEMLRAEGGPVAVYAGSRVTMPYAMAVMGTEMLDEVFKHQSPTLGEVVLRAKRRTAAPLKEEADPARLTNRQMLDALAAALSPDSSLLEEERVEHLQLFNLLGDPLLRIPRPLPVTVKWSGEPVSGSRIQIVGQSELAGKCVLELVARRDTLRFEAPPRENFVPADFALRQYQTTYMEANDPSWARMVFDHPGGAFEQEIEIPASCRGACHVRVYVAGKQGHAMGASDLFIRQPRAVEANGGKLR
jgi:hypothetical protein